MYYIYSRAKNSKEDWNEEGKQEIISSAEKMCENICEDGTMEAIIKDENGEVVEGF